MTHTEEETKQQWQTEDCLETTLMSNLLRTSRPYPRTPYYQVQYNYFLEIQANLEGNINKMKVSDEEPNGNWKILNRETSNHDNKISTNTDAITNTKEETKQQWQTEDCPETTPMSNLPRTGNSHSQNIILSNSNLLKLPSKKQKEF